MDPCFFQRVLACGKMQTSSSKIWTLVAYFVYVYSFFQVFFFFFFFFFIYLFIYLFIFIFYLLVKDGIFQILTPFVIY